MVNVVNVLKNQIVVQTVCKDGKARREINGECCKCPEEIK
jgi:hypothetical protein